MKQKVGGRGTMNCKPLTTKHSKEFVYEGLKK